MARDPRFGAEHAMRLPGGGRLRYRERGEGPVVLFVHGVLATGDLWRDVVPLVIDDAYTFSPLDRPTEVAARITGFVDSAERG